MDKINLKGKRILVTGGNGYLGRNLIKKLLSQGALVSSLDIQKNSVNEGIVYYQVDIREEKALLKVISHINPQLIYHLAAIIDRVRDFSKVNAILEVNLKGTINILNSLKNINYENFIFTSTSEVYGGKKIKAPFKEADVFIPASPYSLSKYNAEMAIKTFSELYNKNYTILRLFNFYGEDMPKSFFLPQLIEKLKNDEDFDMTFGEQKRDFLHVTDILKAMILAIDIEAYNELFNVCSGNGKTIKEIALDLKQLLKSKSDINFGKLPYRNNEVWEMIGDCSKLKQRLNFSPSDNWMTNI